MTSEALKDLWAQHVEMLLEHEVRHAGSLALDARDLAAASFMTGLILGAGVGTADVVAGRNLIATVKGLSSAGHRLDEGMLERMVMPWLQAVREGS